MKIVNKYVDILTGRNPSRRGPFYWSNQSFYESVNLHINQLWSIDQSINYILHILVPSVESGSDYVAGWSDRCWASIWYRVHVRSMRQKDTDHAEGNDDIHKHLHDSGRGVHTYLYYCWDQFFSFYPSPVFVCAFYTNRPRSRKLKSSLCVRCPVKAQILYGPLGRSNRSWPSFINWA